MEVRYIMLIFILTCYRSIVNAAIPPAMESEDVAYLKTLFSNEIHDVEERFVAFKNEMMQENEMLRKSVDELNTKLDKERSERAGAINQLEKKLSEKETELSLEIKDLKRQLISERNERNRKAELLKATTLASLPTHQKDVFNSSKEKDSAISKGSLPEQGKWIENTGKYDMRAKDKEATGTGLKRQTVISGSTQVAFSARLTVGSTPAMNPNQDIVFDHLILNVGSAYHNAHGIFVAPVPGIYFFTTSLLAVGTSSHHAKLVKNGQQLARVDFNDDDNFDDSSQAVIVELKKGDIVAVQNADYSGMLYAGSNYSTFSGFLIYEYEDMSPPVGK